MTGEPPDSLRRIEQRLAAASDAAERLLREATRGTEASRGNQEPAPPPAGWQVPSPEAERSERLGARELELLLAGVRVMGEVVPAEVLERLTAALRELLLAARALIDFYLERIDRPRSEPTDVQDIPID
jgi:hypothetical protein